MNMQASDWSLDPLAGVEVVVMDRDAEGRPADTWDVRLGLRVWDQRTGESGLVVGFEEPMEMIERGQWAPIEGREFDPEDDAFGKVRVRWDDGRETAEESANGETGRGRWFGDEPPPGAADARPTEIRPGVNVTGPGFGVGRVIDIPHPARATVEWADGERTTDFTSVLTRTEASYRRVPKPPMRFWTYDDMEALEEPNWLIEGVIMQGTSALMFGKSNSFKSFVAVDMACSVATAGTRGTGWHGHDISDDQQVLYVATEGARGVAKQRIPGWMDHHGIPREDRDFVAVYPEEIALDDDAAVDDLLKSCAIHSGLRDDVDDYRDPAFAFAFVVLDIMGSTMSGPETSDETARAWVRNINRIKREMRCTVLTVAHTGWADDSRLRGHSHFWGSFDTRLKAEGDKDALTSVLKVDRHKDADSSGEWGFRLETVMLPSGKTTLVPRLDGEVSKAKRTRVSGKPAVALEALSEALAEHGRTISGPNFPSCHVVAIEQWREMCDRHGLTDSESADTRKKAFQRARATLHEKGIIRQFDGFVWRTEPNG